MPSEVFSESELECNKHILAAMDIILRDWKLHENSNLSYELCLHVHGLQGFVLQHMLQRVSPGTGGEWYDDPELASGEAG